MKALLNIGLARKGQPNLTISMVAEALEGRGFEIHLIEVQQSNTEPTAVVKVAIFEGQEEQVPDVELQAEDAVYDVALLLDQDAIAVLFDDGHSDLIGVDSDAWGPFVDEFFLLPGGRRLSDDLLRFWGAA